MTFASTRIAAFIALVTLSVAPLLTGPAAAQYDRRYGASSGSAEEPYEARQDDGGFLGGLFGRGERARREQPQQPPQHAQMPATDLAVRLDRLENHIRQLTGTIEQLQFRNQQLEQQVKRQQEDVEYRLQELNGGRAAPPRRPQPVAQPAAPQVQQAPAVGPGRRSDVFDPNENPGAPGAPQTLGSIPARAGGGPPPVIEEEPLGAPGGRRAGAPLDLGTLSDRAVNDPQVDAAQSPPAQVAAAPAQDPRVIPGALPAPPPRNPNATGAQSRLAAAPSATPRDEFALAQGYIQRRDYALAEESLREFLKKNPSDRLVPEAHYWLGESLYQRQRYRDAAESFLTVSTKYEKSGKGSEALLRLGQSLAALGEREAACATLGEIGRKYPKASPGVKQGVEREQKRVRC